MKPRKELVVVAARDVVEATVEARDVVAVVVEAQDARARSR